MHCITFGCVSPHGNQWFNRDELYYFAIHDAWFVGARQVQKVVKRLANRAQIPQDVTPHVLRHTFATLALQKGISLAAIQKILGHDRLSTTAIYLNLTDTHAIEEYAQKW